MTTTTVKTATATLTIDDMALNIIGMYADSDANERAHGREWYATARRDCAAIATRWTLPLKTVVGVVAVTSPLLQWDRNLQVAEQIIALHNLGMDYRRASTLNNSALRAYRILDGNLSDVERSVKVANFFHCIMGTRNRVCVDRHAYTVATGEPGANAHIGVVAYRLIAQAYREAARDLNMGVARVQAITWLAVRNGKGVLA